MTNYQTVQEFGEKRDKGEFELGTTMDGDSIEVNYSTIESFILSILQSKDQEKDEALKEQEENFLNQKANQHDQMVREKALEDYKVGLMKKLDDILTLLK